MRELLGGQGVVQGLRPFPSQLCISKPKHATEVPLQSVHHALKVWVFSMHTNPRRRTIVTHCGPTLKHIMQPLSILYTW